MPYGLQMEAGPARIHFQGGRPPPTYCWGGQAPGQDSFLGRPAMTYRSQMEAGPARIHSWGGRPPPTYCWAGQAPGQDSFLERPAMTYRSQMEAGPARIHSWGGWPPPTYCWAGQATGPNAQSMLAGPFLQTVRGDWPTQPDMRNEQAGPFPQAATVGWPCEQQLFPRPADTPPSTAQDTGLQGSAWPAYTGSADISCSVIGIGLQGYAVHMTEGSVSPDPFFLEGGPVKDGEIFIRYSSRMKNKGMKVDPIPLTCLLPEPPVGKNKKFTLIRGDLMGSVHTTMTARKDGTDITTMEGKKFARADTCMIINKAV
ncbi:hypothetical protein DFH29DRAFT_881783 [Suillus ampliporus]|nr:hypothetical protein DFH29DRAFT_881783 [Suillus ampliporus]